MGKNIFRNKLPTIRMWIDGKCYNINKFDINTSKCKKSLIVKEECLKDKHCMTKILLPSLYYSKLEKYKTTLVDSLQNDTNTLIKYPTNKNEGYLEITGSSEESIEKAKIQMLSFIATIRSELPALQFIAIPLLSEEIKQNFEKFKNEILNEDHEGVEESIFQSSAKLHLTIAVFTLLNDPEKQEAMKVLREMKEQFQKPEKPLKIRIEGIDCMNNNYDKVHILYANASLTEDTVSNESLQSIANKIFNAFYERGFCREYSESVKLHMTLMNSKYRSKKKGTPKKQWSKRKAFDATQIMAKFKDYYFGEAILDTIHLSLMSSKGKDGFYESMDFVKLYE